MKRQFYFLKPNSGPQYTALPTIQVKQTLTGTSPSWLAVAGRGR